MKISKKQIIDSNKNRKQTSENNSTSKIKSYFKSAPKLFVVENVENKTKADGPDSKEFYVKLLKEKLQSKNFRLLFFVLTP